MNKFWTKDSEKIQTSDSYKFQTTHTNMLYLWVSEVAHWLRCFVEILFYCKPNEAVLFFREGFSLELEKKDHLSSLPGAADKHRGVSLLINPPRSLTHFPQLHLIRPSIVWPSSAASGERDNFPSYSFSLFLSTSLHSIK